MNGYKLEGERVYTYSGPGPLPEGYIAYETTLKFTTAEEQTRQKAIAAMLRIAREGSGPTGQGGCAALYDAGYRKFEIVEEDV